jgi:Domain of unknown function (DUF1877)
MSMTLQLRRAPDGVLGQLPTKGDATFEFLCPQDDSSPAYEDGSIVDIDKTWHAIHYLLTRCPDEADLPAGFLVGGTPIGDDLGYGPARIFKSNEVQEVAALMHRLPEDFVQSELKFSELQAADIYPTIWDR